VRSFQVKRGSFHAISRFVSRQSFAFGIALESFLIAGRQFVPLDIIHDADLAYAYTWLANCAW
jgi:hypothetical protein